MSRVVVDLERVEGEARIIVDFNGAYRAKFMGLDYRAVERVLERQPLYRLPLIASRICGICFISHYIASLKEVYRIKGAVLDAAAAATLEYANTLQHLVDHLLHFFVMSSSDIARITGRRDCVEKMRVKALKLFASWMRIIAKAFGDPVHPMIGFIGSIPSLGEVKRRTGGEEKELAKATLELAEEGERLAEEMLREASSLYPAAANYTYLALKSADSSSTVLGYPAEAPGGRRLKPDSIIEERRGDRHGYIRAVVHSPPYRVGPLARTLLRGVITPAMLQEYSGSPLLYHLARLIELTEYSRRLSEDWTPSPGREVEESAGVVEAPRGLLVHSYRETAGSRRVDVVTPTAINVLAIEHDIETALKEAKPSTEHDIALTASIVARAYNPCLSCAACMVRIRRR